jgi:glycosyltransferase involved in cell wall biosynthesis
MFGTYEAGYDRNRVLREGLEEAGIELIECHEPVWESMRYKTSALKGPFHYLGILWRLLVAYAKLSVRYLRAPDHDVVLVGYLGHFDVFPARILSWLRRKPLVFDAFVSLYDTAVEDRGVFSKTSLPARILKMVDRWSCKLSDLVLLDTDQHIDYFCSEFGLERDRFQRVLVGADSAYIQAAPRPAEGDDTEPFVVLFYGKFAPLHGIRFILDAAHALRHHPDILFRIVGGGQTFDECQAYATHLGLANLELIPWLEPDALREAIGTSGACLGIFGDTAKAERVVPNKVYQCLAAGAPVITGRSAAAEALLHDRGDVLLCTMADGDALAAAILELRNEPALRRRLGAEAAATFRKHFTPGVIVKTELEPRLRALSDG